MGTTYAGRAAVFQADVPLARRPPMIAVLWKRLAAYRELAADRRMEQAVLRIAHRGLAEDLAAARRYGVSGPQPV
jgi:hypothetical protein